MGKIYPSISLHLCFTNALLVNFELITSPSFVARRTSFLRNNTLNFVFKILRALLIRRIKSAGGEATNPERISALFDPQNEEMPPFLPNNFQPLINKFS